VSENRERCRHAFKEHTSKENVARGAWRIVEANSKLDGKVAHPTRFERVTFAFGAI
jgi:hypothetical protein